LDLLSLEQVDDYPLYTMRYHGAYVHRSTGLRGGDQPSDWACSLLAALGDPDNRQYGRNFDWQFSPALLLFTDPPEGYASVSMVDIAYLGFAGDRADDLIDSPLEERRALLRAPFLPFDGMNEHGLAVGMAAVPPGEMPPDPARETIGSLGIIRQMLDRARDVDEALAILQSYNIDMGGGPALHYLLADPSGRALLIEFYQGEMVVTPNDGPWHQATNFVRAAAPGSAAGECWRYDKIEQRLSAAGGRLTVQQAMALLDDVSQPGTQWSMVYGLSSGCITVTMGRRYDQSHTFHLELAAGITPWTQVRIGPAAGR